MRNAGNGHRRTDNHTKQLRAAGYCAQARGRRKSKGHDDICAHRSRCRGQRGWVGAAAHRASDLWQCQRGHAAHAIRSDDGARPATKDTGLAGRSRQDMAFIQRSELARQATWNGRGRGAAGESRRRRIVRRCDDGNEIPLTWRVTKSSAIGLNPDHLASNSLKRGNHDEEEKPVHEVFLTGVKTLRDRARKNIGEGGVSFTYKGNVDKAIEILQTVLATDIGILSDRNGIHTQPSRLANIAELRAPGRTLGSGLPIPFRTDLRAQRTLLNARGDPSHRSPRRVPAELTGCPGPRGT